MIGEPAARTARRLRNQAVASSVRCCMPGCEFPDLLDVTIFSGPVVRRGNRLSGSDRRPVTGSAENKYAGRSRSVRSTPRVSHSPEEARSAAASTAVWLRRHLRGGARRRTAGTSARGLGRVQRSGLAAGVFTEWRPGRADHLVPEPPRQPRPGPLGAHGVVPAPNR